MRKATQGRTRLQWNLFTQLEDLEYADDICLISEKQQHLEQKRRVANEAKKVGLNINKKKTKIMTVNTARQVKIILEGEVLEDVDRSCYLGSMINNGGADEDVKTRIGKAQNAFNTMSKIRLSRYLSTKTKFRIISTTPIRILL
jgi:hypothetical protein